MATTVDKPPIGHFETLALARPGADPFQDIYVDRMDAGVTRMLPKLLEKINPTSAREGECLREIYLSLHRDVRRQLITHPYFSFWWVKMYEAASERDAARLELWLSHLGRLLIVPALRHDLWPRDLVVQARAVRGYVRLPGAVYDLSASAGTESVEVRVSDDTMIVRSHSDEMTVPVAEFLDGTDPRARQRPYLADTAIEVDGDDDFVEYLFKSINAKPPIEGYGARDLGLIGAINSNLLRCLSSAYRLLRDTWPEIADELDSYTRVVVPYRSAISSTFTEAAFMGAVFMSEAKKPFVDELFTAEHLLHEHSHLRLTLIQSVDPLFACDPNRLFVSPWRKDPRPLIGILHGAFVFARIAHFLGLIRDAGPNVEVRRREVVASLGDALTVLTSGDGIAYTQLGELLIDEIREEAS